MKNFFALIGVLVVLFIGVGIWQGWFKFAVNSDNKVTGEFDAKKAAEDSRKWIEAGKEKLEDLKKKDDTPSSGQTPPATTPGPFKGK